MKQQSVESFPLSWPDGWQRTPKHLQDDGNRFRVGDGYEGYGESRRWVGKKIISFDNARQRLVDELGRLKAKGVVLSTNVPLRLDGQPRADAARARMDDPGVAVYFSYKGKPMVMAADGFSNVAANMRSLGLAIEALRQLERHGGGVMMERAFAGFTALPAPEGSTPKRAWWVVLNYGEDPEARADLSVDEVEARFKTLAKRRHPDADGGSTELMAELNQARDDAVRDLGG
jgi:hypothetical protein